LDPRSRSRSTGPWQTFGFENRRKAVKLLIMTFVYCSPCNLFNDFYLQGVGPGTRRTTHLDMTQTVPCSSVPALTTNPQASTYSTTWGYTVQ
jgi:hypothetical protein